MTFLFPVDRRVQGIYKNIKIIYYLWNLFQ